LEVYFKPTFEGETEAMMEIPKFPSAQLKISVRRELLFSESLFHPKRSSEVFRSPWLEAGVSLEAGFAGLALEFAEERCHLHGLELHRNLLPRQEKVQRSCPLTERRDETLQSQHPVAAG